MSAMLTTESDLWLAFQSRIANITHNWDQQRTYDAEPVARHGWAGFTETWGGGHRPGKDTKVGVADRIPPSPKSTTKTAASNGEATALTNADTPSSSVSSLSPASTSVALSCPFEYEVTCLQHIFATPYPYPYPQHQPRTPPPPHWNRNTKTNTNTATVLTLFQFRPAWEEQLTLRILDMPFVVLNSTYAVSEATGPLPALCEVGCHPTSSQQNHRPPVRVGRKQSKSSATTTTKMSTTASKTTSITTATIDAAPSRNAILDYLRDAHGEIWNDRIHSHYIITKNDCDNDNDSNGENSPTGATAVDAPPAAAAAAAAVASSAQLYIALIDETLEPCLTRLELDKTAREQVYNGQVQAAGSYHKHEHNNNKRENTRSCKNSRREGGGWRTALMTRWQTWSEAVHRTRQLTLSQRQLTVEQALHKARGVFDLLEQQLIKSIDRGSDRHHHHQVKEEDMNSFFMGTARPGLVDIVVWASIARSLANLHLVVVLADYPRVCRYAQRLWDTFFNVVDDQTNGGGGEFIDHWKIWNATENARNAFATLPMITTTSMSNPSTTGFQHARDLMQKLSLQREDLPERLARLTAARKQQIKNHYGNTAALDNGSSHYWYESPTSAQSEADRQREVALAKQAKDDQRWLAMMIVATSVFILGCGFARKE